MGGGGGFGDPLDREPWRVLEDVRDEYVSIEAAERDYAVVIHRNGRGYDLDVRATDDLRAARRSSDTTGLVVGSEEGAAPCA
jgi:N-methylhydantoinase B